MNFAMLALNAPIASHDLTRHWAGYAAVAVFIAAYMLVIAEEKIHLRKSKPVILAAGLIWMLVGFAYVRKGSPDEAAQALRGSIGEYAELFLFVLVAMTFVSLMEERKVFDSLRSALVRRRLTLRQIFWLTGVMSFFISSQLDNLTTALVMGTVVLTVGRGHPKFIAIACINVVIAANAGGAWSAFGDITTLMVWQSGKVQFFEFYRIFVPSLVNWFIPAFFMQFGVPKLRPDADGEVVRVKRGGFGTLALFGCTIALAVSSYNLLKLPPVIGMTTGLGLLMMYGYYLKRTHTHSLILVPIEPALGAQMKRRVFATAGAPASNAYGSAESKVSEEPEVVIEGEGPFDIFATIRKAEWDTLLFFYGIILAVGGLAFIGYLHTLSTLLYTDLGPTTANVMVGIISAFVDNIPVMFAVLNMDPAMNLTQWLLVTLTAGVGGSMLSIGSAAGVGLMGVSKGQYTFMSHLKWTWAIALGYAAAIWVHLLIN